MFGAAQYGLVEVKGDFYYCGAEDGDRKCAVGKAWWMTASAPPVHNIILISKARASRVSRTVMHTTREDAKGG